MTSHEAVGVWGRGHVDVWQRQQRWERCGWAQFGNKVVIPNILSRSVDTADTDVQASCKKQHH